MKVRFSLVVVLVFLLIVSFSSLSFAGDFSLHFFDLQADPEVFVGGPIDNVKRGDNAEFWAMIDAEALSYQWWSDDGKLSDNNFVSGSSSEVLILKNVSCENNKKHYWCVITYDKGTVCTEKVELKVDHVYDRPAENEFAMIKNPTCTERGICYAACDCGVWGKDIIYIDELGHDDSGCWLYDEESHWKVCTVCNDVILIGKHEREISSKSCSVCEMGLGHIHELSEIPYKEPTCNEPGQKVCYLCSSCGSLFADPEGKMEVVEYSELIIPATGHIYDQKRIETEYLQSKADCENAARYYFVCKCGDKGKDTYSYGERSDHHYGSWIKNGDEHYRQCSACEKIADRNGHIWETVQNADEYKECYRCLCGAEKIVLSHPFRDVLSSDWFYEDVLFAYHENLLRGLKFDTFGPNEPTSRAMIVTILYRMEGEPVVGSSSFYDVENGSWYGKAVTWAAERNLVNGYGNGSFGPNDPVTREQIAAILYRYTVYKNGNVSSTVSLDRFPDVDKVSLWAKQPMSWAVSEGLIHGVGKENLVYLCPLDNAMRSQIAAILHRYLN